MASIKGQLKRVGTVKGGEDIYKWLIAFSPRYFAAIIVQIFKSSVNRDDSIRVFWLMDWKSPESDWSDWETLAAKARGMKLEQINSHELPASEPTSSVADTQA